MIAIVIASLLFVPAPAPETVAPQLNGQCQFGKVEQVGRRVTIDGPDWIGAGEIRNGVAMITWTHRLNGRAAVGAYRLDGRTLTGHWGWLDEIEVFEQDICGERLMSEAFTVTVEK